MKIFDVLKKGGSLQNPEFWKSAMNVVNLCSAFIPVIVVIIPQAQILIDTDFLVKLYSSLAAANVYFTTGTTVKIGV